MYSWPDSSELGRLTCQYPSEVYSDVMRALPTHTCEVFLNEEGAVRWRSEEDGLVETRGFEPHASFFTRFDAGLAGMLAIRCQL